MTPLILRRLLAPAALLALMLGLPATAQPPLPPPEQPEVAPQPPEKPEPGVNVLDKGPIHEGFAQPGADVRGKDITAPKAPPPPIPEVPPETKPDGENVKWVPGYWLWDGDRKDFTWVSGFWRNAPAGRDWQAGEWKKDKDGNYAYSPGFWRPTNMNSWRVDLPEPPKTVENGPSTPSTDPNAIWVPGSWVFNNGQYAWRPGYWAQPNGNQVWQPGQYLSTPSGYAYNPGYWDYPLENRGLLNAPVYFSSPLWQNPGWGYRPRFALGLGVGNGWGTGGLFSSLYIGPGYNNYYYGNYGYSPYSTFGGSWLGVGSPYWGSPWMGFGSAMWGSPWLGFGSPMWGPMFGGSLWALGGYGPYVPWWYTGYRGYANPLWRHYAWLNRGNPNWANNVHNTYVNRALGVNAPVVRAATVTPHTGIAGAMGTAVQHANNASRAAVTGQATPLVQPASQVAKSIAAHQAVHSTNAVNGVAGRGNGVGATGSGLSITPNHGVGVGAGAGGPLHTGSTNAMQQLHGVNSVPQIHYGGVGGSMPQIHQINPGGALNSGVHPGLSQSVPQIHYGTPGISGAHIPSSLGSSFNPGVHSMPSLHSPSFSSGMSRFGGISGGHVGGMSGGHVGGGHAGGGHGGHR